MATNSRISTLIDDQIRRIIGQPSTAYDTHRPVLAEAIIRTTGPILELGMGEGSTPGLHEVSQRTGRFLTSYEDDAEWFKKMAPPKPRGNWVEEGITHMAFQVRDWDEAALDVQGPAFWSVALVDHGQMHRRVREIGRLAHNCEVVVVHDTEDWRYQYWSIYGLFKYRLDYMKIKPWTTAFSNTIDVSEWQIP